VKCVICTEWRDWWGWQLSFLAVVKHCFWLNDWVWLELLSGQYVDYLNPATFKCQVCEFFSSHATAVSIKIHVMLLQLTFVNCMFAYWQN